MINELNKLTFQHEGQTFHADDTSDTGLVAWTALVNLVADLKRPLDWKNLETRSHFLNLYYRFCLTNHLTFRLTIDTELSIRLVEKI